MESSQGPGAAGEQTTREFPSVDVAAGQRSSASPPPPPPAHDPFAERPELYVGAAFAGGLIFAKFLKRFGR